MAPYINYRGRCVAADAHTKEGKRLTDYEDTMKVCDVQPGGTVWKYAKDKAYEGCKEKLCNRARLGMWYSKLWLVRYKPTKIPWPRKWHGRGARGFEETFDAKCWKGPKGVDVLGDFETFAKHYKLISDSGNFDKTVCGCPDPDDCSGIWKWK